MALVGTLGDAGWYRTNVTAVPLGTDTASGVALSQVRVDDGSWQDLPSATLSDGVHYVQYRSVDQAGNTEAAHAQVVRVDATGPRFTTVSAPPGIVTSSSVTISWIATDALSGITGYNVSVDFGPAVAQGTSTSKTLSLADGDHAIVMIAWSGAGAFARVGIHFHVDTSPLSPTGPYGVAIPVGVIVIGVAAVAILLWQLVLRKRPRKPSTSETDEKSTDARKRA